MCYRGMDQYEFAQATTAIYSFFLYDFCDVYLEVTKPIFGNTENAAAAQVNVMHHAHFSAPSVCC
jgi:valyl-tRNA synthetase